MSLAFVLSLLSFTVLSEGIHGPTHVIDGDDARPSALIPKLIDILEHLFS